VVDEKLVYLGRCRDNYDKRINRDYGKIYPKNCFLDGQATNSHLNFLINRYRNEVEFYVYPMNDDTQIKELEKQLILRFQPTWNIALRIAGIAKG
jgi:hypothetical protein